MPTLIKNVENENEIINLDLVNTILRSNKENENGNHYIYFVYSAVIEADYMKSGWSFATEESRDATFNSIAHVFGAVGL